MNFLQQLISPLLRVPSLDDDVVDKGEKRGIEKEGRDVEPLNERTTQTTAQETRWGAGYLDELDPETPTMFNIKNSLTPVIGQPKRRFGSQDEIDF